MNQKFIYYIIFVLTFLLFNFVQEHARPNYSGDNQLIIYCLGVLPNFLPGIGLPSLLYVLIPEVFQPGTPLFKERLKWSLSISMVGLIGNEFITNFTPGKGVFDWNDALATLIGGGVFLMIHRYIGGSIAAG